MVKMVSIDSSSRCTGWAYWENGKLVDHGIIDLKSSKLQTIDRIKEMGKLILKLLQTKCPDIVVVEEEVIGSSTTTRMLAMIIGIIMSWAIAKNKEFIMSQPSHWRSMICNEGESYPKKREDVKPWDIKKCKELFGIEAGDDECDGILIGQAYINEFN